MSMVPFIGPSYEDRVVQNSVQRTVNLYPQKTENADGKSVWTLIGTPGTTPFTNISSNTGVCRGLHYASTGQLFAAIGNALYEIDSVGGDTKVATITGTAPVSFTDNGTYLIFADGFQYRTYHMSAGTLAAPTLPTAVTTPQKVYWFGRRVVLIDGTSSFYWSEINDPATWSSLNVRQNEVSADPYISSAVVGGEIWLFGARSYDVFRISSNPDQPYARVGGSSVTTGCGAKYSVAEIGDSVFWLGSSKAGANMVYTNRGYAPVRISNHAIEKELNEAGTTNGAISFTYQQEGHVFYVLTLPTADKTFVYDLTTGQWHERATRDANKNILYRWFPRFAAYFPEAEKVIIGNSDGPQLLELDLDTYNDNFTSGEARPIRRIRQSPVYWDGLKTMFHWEFQVDLESGTGLQTGQGSDPQIMLQYSDDGGRTWSSERWVSLGAIGAYSTRARWRRLGRSRERVYRVEISDPIKVGLIGARVIAEPSGNR